MQRVRWAYEQRRREPGGARFVTREPARWRRNRLRQAPRAELRFVETDFEHGIGRMQHGLASSIERFAIRNDVLQPCVARRNEKVLRGSGERQHPRGMTIASFGHENHLHPSAVKRDAATSIDNDRLHAERMRVTRHGQRGQRTAQDDEPLSCRHVRQPSSLRCRRAAQSVDARSCYASGAARSAVAHDPKA
jgi:hypothetical protein